ncbi:GDSL-like Lipase/Acylhydrolase superfamily protein [Perilla frutescens var. hirtella]|uniref:GDSL-like Lipase/Acylhydrolase superfamily protein n=1 Tax=Perilla frutescens var. hirtella TaxID=608512 RepID=A0AAD4JHM4_PERFH|nr:GDSL-like Lipase/Acylhydrolase superfamily protein [Perilla frutescens var. hirtella]
MWMKILLVALSLVVLSSSIHVTSSSHSSSNVSDNAQASALFVFGDSLVDNGNNNFLSSIAKSNYYPYGIDSPRGVATGKFSNGDTFVDYLGAWLGLPAPPPFADPTTTGARILGGVNYASAAAGILDETGQHYGQRYSLSQQVMNFETTVRQLRPMIPNLSRYLSKSIAVLVFGSNDYINNYLLPTLYPSRFFYNSTQFATLLLNHYERQLLALYAVGLRKFVLPGVGPLGCIPNQLATASPPPLPGRCVDSVNQMLGDFNRGLVSLVDTMNNGSLPGSMFVYGNTYSALGDILNNPARYGFAVVDRGCCGIGRQITCLPWTPPCANRNEYVFWDAFHPTQGVDAFLAQRAYAGPPSDCHPINVQQLALINFA